MTVPLILEDVRGVVTTPLSDDALQVFVDAAWASIVARYGETGEVTEVHLGGGTVLALNRPVESITSIVETNGDTITELTADDYRFAVGSAWLTRLNTGTNYAAAWATSVEVGYTPEDDTADRTRVFVKLIALDINNVPGLTAQVVGEVSESFAANSVFNYRIEREAILDSLLQTTGSLFS